MTLETRAEYSLRMAEQTLLYTNKIKECEQRLTEFTNRAVEYLKSRPKNSEYTLKVHEERQAHIKVLALEKKQLMLEIKEYQDMALYYFTESIKIPAISIREALGLPPIEPSILRQKQKQLKRELK